MKKMEKDGGRAEEATNSNPLVDGVERRDLPDQCMSV